MNTFLAKPYRLFVCTLHNGENFTNSFFTHSTHFNLILNYQTSNRILYFILELCMDLMSGIKSWKCMRGSVGPRYMMLSSALLSCIFAQLYHGTSNDTPSIS